MSKAHKLLLGSFILLTLQVPAQAQITPDNTLGKESSILAPSTINGSNADLINGGQERGANLFHSFTQFNIGNGQRVYFGNPAGVQNIFTRVTGGQASNIFGTLGVNGAANLFLINPSGILFGKNASLDLRGSFVGTTASSIKFADGSEFNAQVPQNNQLLTISVPIGLQFGKNQPGAIVNAGNLAVNPGHNLSLIGGSVAVTGNVVAPGGEINIAAVPSNSLVEINQFGNLYSITSTATEQNTTNTPSLIQLLKNTAPSDTGIKVTGNNQIELENGITVSADVGTAIISALIDASTYQSGKTGGVVRVLGDNVGLFNSTVIGVNGDAGGGTVFVGGDTGANKLINATNAFVDDHVYINASAISQGNGGNISVWSNGNTQFFGYATTLSPVSYGQTSYNTETGNSGTVTIGALKGLIYNGLVNTYFRDDYSANKIGTLILNYPELAIVDTPLVNNNYSNLSQNYNQISWVTIANNLAETNLNLFTNGDVIINNIANNEIKLQIPKPLSTPTTLGINSSGNIYFTNTKNTINTSGISIKWIANKDIITGSIRTNSSLGLSVGGQTGNIFMTSINGKINTSAGQLDTSSFYTNSYTPAPGINTGRVKLEAYGDIITSDIITLSRRLRSNDIIIISKAGGIDTSSGRLDTSATRLSTSGYVNSGSVTLDAYGKIRTGSIYTDGNAGGQIDITSHNDGIDTTSGTITAFGFYGSVGNVNINAKDDIYAGNIATDFTLNKSSRPFSNQPFDTIKGIFIENPRGGSINIQGAKFFLNGHTVSANTSSNGGGGAISINTSDGITIQNGGVINTEVKPNAKGNGGEINLITNGSLLLENGAKIINSTSGKGNGGKVTINALGGVTLNNNSSISTSVASGSTGNSGEIDIKTLGQFALQNNSIIQTSTAGIGNAAKVTLDAKSNINIENGSQINTQVLSGSVGNGSDINLRSSGILSLVNGSQLRTNTNTNGNAGNIDITATNGVNISGTNINNGQSSGLFTSTLTNGRGGDIAVKSDHFQISDGAILNAQTTGDGLAGSIKINTNTFDVKDGGQITSSTSGSGNSGNITINASQNARIVGNDSTYLDRLSLFGRDSVINNGANSGLFTESQGTGEGGKLTINTPSLQVLDGAKLSAATGGQGIGGTLEISTSGGSVTVDGVGSSLITDTRGDKNAGNLTVNTSSLQVNGGGKISASTSGQGNGGTLKINAPSGGVQLGGKNSNLTTSSSGRGNAGNLMVNTGQLQVFDGAQILTSTDGQGTGGTLDINALSGVSVTGAGSNLSTDTRGAKNAGNLTVNTSSLQVNGGGKISASTFGQGNGGTLKINAQSGLVQLAGKSSSLNTSSSGRGNAGNLTVNTGQLQVFDGAQILTSTEGQGSGGTLNINAPKEVWVTGTGSNLSTDTLGSKNAGNLTINTNSLRLLDKGQVSASTSGQGNGGTLEVNADKGNVQISGGELSAQSFNTGTAGNLNISTLGLQVKDNGLLTVSARDGQAGNININANSVNLSNRAKITSQTGAGNGGNITINSNNMLLMRRGSEISTTAGTELLGGDGGNISINTPFIIAAPTENSDISANAFSGRGGNVNIRAQSILGITPRLKASPLTSDITASSDLGVQGQVNVIQPEVQPQQGIVELPEEVIDATRRVAAICPREPGAKPLGEFTVVGRGSLPPSPLEPLPGTSTTTLATLDTSKISNISSIKQAPPTPPTQIIEAQGFVKTSDGNIELVAAAPNVTPSLISARAVCPQSE